MELEVVHMMEHEPVSNIGRDRLGPDHINFRALNAKKRGTVGWRKEIVPHWWTRFPFRACEVEAAHAGGRHHRSVGLKALDADGLDQKGQVQSGIGFLGLEGFRRPPQRIEQRRVRRIGLDGPQDDEGLRSAHDAFRQAMAGGTREQAAKATETLEAALLEREGEIRAFAGLEK